MGGGHLGEVAQQETGEPLALVVAGDREGDLRPPLAGRWSGASRTFRPEA